MPLRRIDEYEIERQLPSDWLGERYVARASAEEAPIVLRLPHRHWRQEPGLLAAIASAPVRLRDIAHPFLILTNSGGRSEGWPYLIEPFSEGENLASCLNDDSSPWPLPKAMPWLQGAVAALAAGHALGLIHGHLHPAAIRAQSDGNVVIGDWGLIWTPDPNSAMLQAVPDTDALSVVAPELALGYTSPNKATDLYALAAIAYRLLVGCWPFSADDGATAIAAYASGQVIDPRRHHPELDAGVVDFLNKGLALNPAARFASTTDFAEALLQLEQPWQRLNLSFVTIPAGSFLYGEGSTTTAQVIPAFRITVYPVTVHQFAAFVEDTAYVTTAEREGWGLSRVGGRWRKTEGANWRTPRRPDSKHAGGIDHPVVQIAYADALAFCEWAHCQLPNERQWEKAARGKDGRRYPWGNHWQTGACRHAGTGEVGTAPVTAHPDGASPYGVQDMVGNVWEWTSSNWDETGDYQVLRGGAWPHPEDVLTTTYRYYALAGYRSDALGFRCSLPVDHETDHV